MEAEQSWQGFERRRGERRTKKQWFMLRERRSGFDRRRLSSRGVAAAIDRALWWLHQRPRAVAWVLISANVLNVLDLLLTVNVLLWGGTEANPIMHWLLERDPVLAWIFKVVAIAAASVVLWSMRRFRLALAATVGLAALFGVVLLYHLSGLVIFYW